MQDYTQAISWFRKSAAQGDSRGQAYLGVAYEQGLGVEQDYTQAVSWYRKSAAQGDSRGQVNLGVMYEHGHGVNQNYTQAVRWFRKSAAQGDSRGQASLGSAYATGRSVNQNYTHAVRWFRKSAAQGDSRGQAYLGVMYGNGQGVELDYTQAVSWFRKSAEQGDEVGQVKLAFAYSNGLGVPKSDIQALHWFKKAANNGSSEASEYLGYMYENGLGVTKNLVTAKRWYNLNAGVFDSNTKAESISENATATDIYNILKDAVFYIQTPSATGSGVAISATQIATNCHVVEDAETVNIQNEIITTSASVTKRDSDNDVCILKPRFDLTDFVRVASSDDVTTGDRVYTIGSPLGIENSFSDGLVSNTHAPQKLGFTLANGKILQFTAPISPGSSGGGLFNSKGELIGITTLTLKESQALNIAIPADWFMQ